MAYTQEPGRGPMQKTGRSIPSALLQEKPVDIPKKKLRRKATIEEVQEKFPNKIVSLKKNTDNEYSVSSKDSGKSFSYKPGKVVVSYVPKTDAEVVSDYINEEGLKK